MHTELQTMHIPLGAVDEFEVVAAVGELRAVRIGHDGSGPDPAWRLQVGGGGSVFVAAAVCFHCQ